MPDYDLLYGEYEELKEENSKLRLENDDLRQEISSLYEAQQQTLEELAVTQRSVDFYLQENKRLKWRVNHVTPDDAEACRQGKHEGTDCGKE